MENPCGTLNPIEPPSPPKEKLHQTEPIGPSIPPQKEPAKRAKSAGTSAMN